MRWLNLEPSATISPFFNACGSLPCGWLRGAKLNKFFLLCGALSVAGCVGHYQQPALGEPHATLKLMWGDNRLEGGGSQGYWAYSDADCLDTNQTGVLGALSKSEPERNRYLIQPNGRIYLQAMSSGIRLREDTQQPMVHIACMSISSFVPRAGSTYKVTHTAPMPGCSLQVIDLQTGQAPSTLQVESISKSCGL